MYAGNSDLERFEVRQYTWGLGVVSVFLHSLVDYPMQKPAVALWLFVLLGAMSVRKKSKRSFQTTLGANAYDRSGHSS